MFNFQNIVIVFLGIIISFWLLAEGNKYNRESYEYGQAVQSCELNKFKCDYQYIVEFEKRYGAPYGVLRQQMAEQKIFVIIPFIILIITLFVSFTLNKKEVLFTVLVLIPFLFNFIVRYIFAQECCLIPVYLLYAVGLSFVFSYLKRIFLYDSP